MMKKKKKRMTRAEWEAQDPERDERMRWVRQMRDKLWAEV